MGPFDGKVVIVTGAGGGLGRAHAIGFAREGASVVVNDLGGTRDGSGGGSAMADQVVAEIKAAGGKAVANYDNVATADGGLGIARTAIEHFGRIDILVNNAGILRDKTFAKMDESMWDAVMAVHTKQLFAVTQPVVAHMLERAEGGRIINTTSLAGLLGNYGQTNYSTAKAGTYGFTRTLSMELKKAGITVNAVAPVAKTRMTEDISMVPDEFTPEQITAMVLFLASEKAAAVTGRVFGVHGQQIFEYVMKQTPGVTKEGTALWDVDEIAARFDDITREESAAKPAAATGDDDVTVAFAQIPKGFKKADAGSWKAVLHWKIKGGTDQTLSIADGNCTHQKGLAGTPSCTVKTDSDTVMAMFQGKLDPTKAFMAGKISADNLPDMMKMGGAFDFPTIGVAIAEALSKKSSGGGAAAAPAGDPVTEAFSVVPHAFRPDKAGDWRSTIHFEVKGGTSQTITIGDGKCAVKPGLDGKADCVVKVDAQTVIGMFDGSVDGTKAFMAGKISASDLGTLMRFSQVFKFDPAAAKAAAKAARTSTAPASTAPAAAPAKKAIDFKAAIGRRYKKDFVQADAGSMVGYAEATNDANPRYARGRDQIAPPLYPVRLFQPLMFECVGDPELDLDMLKLVHGEQDMTWHGPIRPGDVVNLRGVLESISQKSKGCVASWQMMGLVDGEVRVEALMGVFVRGQMLPGVEPGTTLGRVVTPPEGAPEGSPVATGSMPVAMDQPHRYAKVSLDDNPIHTDDATARAAGHPSVILHGLCTMAFANKALVDGLLAGDPSRLHRFAVRFTKPVLPGWTLTTKVYAAGKTPEGRSAYRVETVNQDGVVVAGNGWAEVDG